MKPSDDESEGPVIRDRRRIDPQTGEVRDPNRESPPQPGKHSASKPGGSDGQGQPAPGTPGAAAPAAPAGPVGASEPGGVAAALAERTADLQRLQAEYANYRKRVERDRSAVREQALASVLSELLPVLDDIGRAREHGELTGGFKSVAESLESSATKLGLTAYGENGDPFDPTLHDALMHSYSAEVTEPTCVQILQPGYKVGDRIIRPARVAVAEPAEDGDDDASPDAQTDGDEEQDAPAGGAGSPDDTGTAGR
jgi:molecular chaperone GrpE